MSVLEQLRLATGPLHAELESRLDLIARLSRPAERAAIVARFHGLHAGTEPSLATWLDPVEGLDFAARRRSPSLAADLRALGLQPAAIPPCPAPRLASRPEALGVFYVLEGSSLGGRMIDRALAAGGAEQAGLSFLNPYGAATGERWRAFLAVLEREAQGEAAQAAAVRGGVIGFTLARDWLCAETRAAA